MLDVEALLTHLITLAHTKGSDLPTSAIAALKRAYLSAVLSVLLSFGASEEIDRVCLESLAIAPSNAAPGICR